MAKTRKILKWSFLTLVTVILFLVGFGFWFINLIKPIQQPYNLVDISPSDLRYLTEDSVSYRGKILAVVTSCSVMGDSEKSTGFEMSELARAYYVFTANGFEVNIASPLGGQPPEVRDDEDMGAYDYAFINDEVAQAKLKNSIPVDQVDAQDYEAIYFVGGKGTLFDFPNNQHIQALVREQYEAGKTVGAVCHGPAALVNVTLSDGSPLVANKRVSGFTNQEELFLIPEARNLFPFLLQDKLTENGARFDEGFLYLQNVTRDGQLVTGQNPWSTWAVAEGMIESMGYAIKPRPVTTEENAVEVLGVYASEGYGRANEHLHTLHDQYRPVNRELLAVHGILAVMQWDLGKAVQLVRLLANAKAVTNEA